MSRNSSGTRRHRSCATWRASPLLLLYIFALSLLLLSLDASSRVLHTVWHKPLGHTDAQRSNPVGGLVPPNNNSRTPSDSARLVSVISSVEGLIPKNGKITAHLDHTLNPRVTTTVHIGSKVEDDFDQSIFDLMSSQHMVIHQTWKDRCILDEKIPIMKTWLGTETSLKVVFWTDASMDLWMMVGHVAPPPCRPS